MIHSCRAVGSGSLGPGFVFWFVISIYFRHVTAGFAYDRSDPGFPENFDPQFADPLGRITCIGPLPEADWPRQLEQDGHIYNPATFSLQQLCAKPQYGGARYGHIGGFCPYRFFGNRDNSARSAIPIIFDLSNQAEASRALSTLRIQLYCMLRCHCTTEPDESPRIQSYSPIARRVPRRHWVGRYISPVNPDVDIFSQHLFSTLHEQIGLSIQINYWQENVNPEKRPNFGKHLTYLPRENTIICDNSKRLASFSLPDGWQAGDFESYQALCATAFDGGNKNANAGGYCNVRSATEPVVAFSAEFTPSLAFTLGGGSLADRGKVIAMQILCSQACRCRVPGDNVDVGLHRLSISDTTNMGSGQSTELLSGKECGSSSDLFTCPNVLPEESSGADMPVCGLQCDKYDDCTGDGKPESCRCLVDPSALQTETIGAQPVLQAICLTMALGLGRTRKHHRPGWLGGRAIAPEPEWWERSEVGCPCNSTYISQSCCHEPSGLVWESAHLKMGSLVRQE